MPCRAGFGGLPIVMNNPVWRIEDGVLLQELRQSAKVDDFVFARMNAISLAQLRELEGQGEGSFYNSQIKANTGHKLLRKLGHAPVMPTPELSLTTAPDAEAETQTPVLSVPTGVSPRETETAKPSRAPLNAMGVHPKWAAALLLIGGLVWTGSHMPWASLASRSFKSQAHAPVPTQPAQTALVPDPSPGPASVVDQPHTASAVLESHAPLAANSVTSDARTSAHCDWRQPQDSAAYEPTDPIKAGNYIHFVAVKDVTLCVRDQKNQLTDLQLKAGSAQSVYGEPPFLVHSPEWQNLQVFFQGRRVIGTQEGSAYWMFKNKDL